MTAQIHDGLIRNDEHYAIVGIKGEGLFSPPDLGVYPTSNLSACWRGYVCTYMLSQDQLRLDALRINLYDNNAGDYISQTGPAINGRFPVGGNSGFNNIYTGLELDIPFTGGLLAGKGFMQNLYVHMGFHPAWKYQTVLELIFDNGHLQEWRDVSQQMERLRNQMIKQPLSPDIRATGRKTIEAWIEDTFKLDYDLG